jgi:acyl-CoA thioester hydrolase
MGVVHHAAYLRWFEASRAKYMRLRGAKYAAVEEAGIQLPVVEAHLTYHKPARYDDVLTILVWVGDLGRLQIKFDYNISMGGDTLVAGYTRHASINMDGRLTRLPTEVREALTAQERETGEAMV